MKIPGNDKAKANKPDGAPYVLKWPDFDGCPATKLYVSDRNLPLLCQEPDTFGRPTVTLENYCKWYGIFVLYPDGRVESIDHGLIGEVADRIGGSVMGDHNFHPRLLNELAKELKGIACYRSIEVAGGRWVNEIMDGELEGFPNFDIPEGNPYE